MVQTSTHVFAWMHIQNFNEVVWFPKIAWSCWRIFLFTARFHLPFILTYFDVTHIFCRLQTPVWSIWLFGMFYAAKASALEFHMYFVTGKESRLMWQLSWRRILVLYREWKSSKYWDLCCIGGSPYNTASNTMSHIYLGNMISTYLVKQVRAIDILHVG